MKHTFLRYGNDKSHKFLINSSLCDNQKRENCKTATFNAVSSCPSRHKVRKVMKHPRIESISITITTPVVDGNSRALLSTAKACKQKRRLTFLRNYFYGNFINSYSLDSPDKIYDMEKYSSP